MLHQIPLKALRNTSGCASCSTLYMHRLLASMRISTIKTEEMIWFLFHIKQLWLRWKSHIWHSDGTGGKLLPRAAYGKWQTRTGKKQEWSWADPQYRQKKRGNGSWLWTGSFPDCDKNIKSAAEAVALVANLNNVKDFFLHRWTFHKYKIAQQICRNIK